VVDDLKKGYYLLFIDGGKRANQEGQAEGAIGVILQEPDCGPVLAKFGEKVGSVGSPQEAEYHALIRGLKLAAEKRLAYVAAFSDSAHVVNQITRGWNKNERATELCEEVEQARAPLKGWQLSWVPRAMNREADKLVDQAFKGEPVIHASDAEGSGTEIVAEAPPPKKAAFGREWSPAELAEYLHGHQTIPDRAWTQVQREKGEKRGAFIDRVLGTAPEDETPLPSEVDAVLDRFFGERSVGLSILGRGDSILERKGPADPGTPMLERLRMLERTLLDALALMAQQHDEVDSYGDYARQLYGEVVATLVALRELWRCAPELRA